MKIELIKEEQYGKAPWYEILIDGKFIKGSFIPDLIEKQYQELIDHPELLEKKRELIKSDEIVLSLHENTKTEKYGN